MNAMLTKYLKDFSVPEAPAKTETPLTESLAAHSPADFDFTFDPEPQIDLEAERRQAHEEGYQMAVSELSLRHTEEIEDLRRQHAEELADIRRQHELDVVGQIHTRFHEMTEELFATVTEQTLDVLLPVLSAELRDIAIAALGRQIRELLSDGGAATLTVKGPSTLYAKLKPLLDAEGVAVRYIESASPDLAVEINEQVLVTRLEGWAQALLEVSSA